MSNKLSQKSALAIAYAMAGATTNSEPDVYKIELLPTFNHGPRRKRYGRSVEVRTEPKIGRNEPCPCGSGKKYKKCCNA